ERDFWINNKNEEEMQKLLEQQATVPRRTDTKEYAEDRKKPLAVQKFNYLMHQAKKDFEEEEKKKLADGASRGGGIMESPKEIFISLLQTPSRVNEDNSMILKFIQNNMKSVNI